MPKYKVYVTYCDVFEADDQFEAEQKAMQEIEREVRSYEVDENGEDFED